MRELSPGMRLPHRFGRYLLQERIGGGGMASVFRATFSVEGGFEKEVALKVIRSELSEDPQFIRMFLDEARLSGSLSHPNIVQTFDFGQVEGIYFLAMELVGGRTLAAILETLRENRLRLGMAASLFVAKELARALDYAHRAEGSDGSSLGIVHRDVSPQNVLISREGHVKLADFGIAKAALRSQVTQPGRVRGKCSYMAPEQARGQDVDARADVFALGAVLWECLVGRRLFDGPSDAAVLLEVIEKDIAPPSRFVPGIPPEVDRAVLRFLERDPQRRPTSAAAYRELADLGFRLARSPEDLDLHHLQQRLASATAAVSKPEIELSTWKSSAESPYPWAVDPDAETIVSDEEEVLAPFQSQRPDDPTRIPLGSDRETLTLGGRGGISRTAEGETRRGRVMVPVAIASALGAALGIAAVTVWNLGGVEAPSFVPDKKEESEAPRPAAREMEEPPAKEEVALADDPERKPPDENMEALPPPAKTEPLKEDVSIFPSPTPRVSPPSSVATPAQKPGDRPEVSKVSSPPEKKPIEPDSEPDTSTARGTLVITSRVPDVAVRFANGRKETLSPLSPRSIELPAGETTIRFSQASGDTDCTVSVRVEENERLALLFDAQGVFALSGLEREPLPCR